MKVLVTGATGFIGTHLIKHLSSSGFDVLAITRRASPPPDAPYGVRWKRAQSLSQLASQAAFWESERIDAVAHLAAHVHVLGDSANRDARTFRKVNVEETLAVAHAAQRAGVRRFLFMSSVKVHGDESGPHPLTEESPFNPADAYAYSKLEAEQGLRKMASRMELVVLRPPLVYGPGVGANFHRLMVFVARGWPLPFASLKNNRSVIYVGNLVHAAEKCLCADAAARETFFVSDRETISTPELLRTLARSLGARSRLFPTPPALLHYAACLAGHRQQSIRLLGSLAVDCAKIRRLLAWTPPFSLEAGLAETVSWLHAHEGTQPSLRLISPGNRHGPAYERRHEGDN